MLGKILSNNAFYQKRSPKEFSVRILLPVTKVDLKLHTHSVQKESESVKQALFKKFELQKEELHRIQVEYFRTTDPTGEHFLITKIIFLYTDGDGRAVLNKVTGNNWWKKLVSN